MSQKELATHAGVSKRCQLQFELNVSNPNARYLEKIAFVGCDVLYVITGNRAMLLPLPTARSERESAMLSRFDFADEAGRAAIENAAATAIAKQITQAS